MPHQPRRSRHFVIEKLCNERLSFGYFHFYALYVCIFRIAILLPVVNTKSRRMAQVWPKCFYATSVAMAAKAVQNIATVNCAPGQLLLGSQYLLGTLALIRITLNINPKEGSLSLSKEGSVKDCEKSSNRKDGQPKLPRPEHKQT